MLGGKKHIASEEDEVEDGKFKGKSALAAFAAETFLMQFGGGMPVGWGKLGGDQAADVSAVYDLLRMQVYNWQVTRRALPIEQAKSSQVRSAVHTTASLPRNTHGV